MSKKKSSESPNSKEPKVESPTQEQLEKDTSMVKSEVLAPEGAEQEEPILITLDDIQRELNDLKELVSEHTNQIIYLQNALTRKRGPTSNGKIKILDKATGEIYPSKNQAYRILLKGGELKELVEKGVFGPDPEKNTFGWYALVRAWPERFEEMKAEEAPAEAVAK